ncbi:hypothetical protein E2C01_002784 [Portunus trituberculatus]|uniref:Uncharacterized protein n=1 Tax=Portunus trituberculatus TaxID=210409 RepID=A0A5B7CLN6_PORTR|nr:hypothetical protein [Portunus trituberculatus]
MPVKGWPLNPWEEPGVGECGAVLALSDGEDERRDGEPRRVLQSQKGMKEKVHINSTFMSRVITGDKIRVILQRSNCSLHCGKVYISNNWCLSVVAEGEEVGHALCTYAVGEDRRRWMDAEEASEAVRRWKRGERPRRGEQRGEERAPRPPTLGTHTHTPYTVRREDTITTTTTTPKTAQHR